MPEGKSGPQGGMDSKASKQPKPAAPVFSDPHKELEMHKSSQGQKPLGPQGPQGPHGPHHKP